MVRPYLKGIDCGVFATRSPARPNHIGMSSVRLLGVQGCTLLVSDIDILDGTPLLDIKPYVPAFDSFPRNEWVGTRMFRRQERSPDDRFERP